MKRVIGITGTIAAGKDTAAEYISQKIGYPIFQVSSPLKEAAIAANIPITRENLINLGRELSHEHGMDYLARVILEKIDSVGIITGMRKVPQIEYLRNNSDFTLIAIDADPKVRFERTKARAKPGEAETLDQFLENEKEENNKGFQDVFACMNMADYKITNHGNKENLSAIIDEILEKENLIIIEHN